MKGSFYTKEYRNVFKECGYNEEEISKRLEEIFQTMFYGSEEERIYHESGEDMAYFVDTGNNDARTEGMSYAMMMCVQLGKRKEFDRLWKWAKTYMWTSEGKYRGYFAWSCALDGTKNYDGPAPDGEEYFAMALFFAAHRFGDGEGIFNYSREARAILHECVHKGEAGTLGRAMWDPDNKLIRFVPEADFTDPSYHLPHFYDLFALWANEEDHEFWQKAAANSRVYMKTACDKNTGLAPEYSYFDGTPYTERNRDRYYSDAYRVPANLGMDYLWFAKDEWECEITDKLQTFFCETVKGREDLIYKIDGTIIEEKALHPVAIIATNAEASLASHGKYAKECVGKFWNTPLRTGERRYYDNCLYLFAFLALSGNYRIW